MLVKETVPRKGTENIATLNSATATNATAWGCCARAKFQVLAATRLRCIRVGAPSEGPAGLKARCFRWAVHSVKTQNAVSRDSASACWAAAPPGSTRIRPLPLYLLGMWGDESRGSLNVKGPSDFAPLPTPRVAHMDPAVGSTQDRAGRTRRTRKAKWHPTCLTSRRELGPYECHTGSGSCFTMRRVLMLTRITLARSFSG